MLFGNGKRLNPLQGGHIKLSVNGSPINTTTCYKYILTRHFTLKHIFKNIYKKAAGRVNLLRHIGSSIDSFSAQQIYQSMIILTFTYCGYVNLGWSEFRKCMIRSIETRSVAIISRKCSPQKCDLRLLTIDDF